MTPEEKLNQSNSKLIDKEIKKEIAVVGTVCKILILGAADSGKSTFLKQIMFLYGNGLANEDYMKSFCHVLRENALQGMQILLAAMKRMDGSLPEAVIEFARQLESSAELDQTSAVLIDRIFKNDKVKLLLDQQGDNLNIPGGKQGANYYFANCVRFAATAYIPTKEDVLMARKKTSCVSETFFDINNHKFSFVDVGGQRSERKNWLSVFQSTTAIIYLCSIADYDLILEESPDTNRFAESLRLWKSITAYKVFKDTPFILFLNKSDLFEEKIKRVPLSDYFENFGAFFTSSDNAKLSEFERSWKFLLEQFTRGCEIKYFYHLTNSLNTELTKKIFAQVQTSIWSDRMNTLM